MKQVEIPSGTIVKIKGIPFRLVNPVIAETEEENYKLSLSHDEQLSLKPNQAAVPDNVVTNNLSLLPM